MYSASVPFRQIIQECHTHTPQNNSAQVKWGLSKRIQKGDASLCPKGLAMSGTEDEGVQALIFLTTAEIMVVSS